MPLRSGHDAVALYGPVPGMQVDSAEPHEPGQAALRRPHREKKRSRFSSARTVTLSSVNHGPTLVQEFRNDKAAIKRWSWPRMMT